MNQIDTSHLLAQLRATAAAAQGRPPVETAATDGPGAVQFSSLLKQSVDRVNDLQKTSSSLGEAFELGDPNVGLAQVMIARQKASISFEALVQVRNKLLQAYKDVMSMPV